MGYFVRKGDGESFVIWHYDGTDYKCQILPQVCPKCRRAGALIQLPKPMLEKQPDGTNVVCFPGFAGCNHGFSIGKD